MKPESGSSARLKKAALGGVTGALLLSAGALALQSTGEPAVFRPGVARKPPSLPRGEVLLVQLFQALADTTGSPVCFTGDDPPEAVIALPRALEGVDAKSAAEILEKGGYELSSAIYKGKQVHWVQKLIVPPRTRGKILRGPGRESKAPEQEASPEAPAVPAVTPGGAALETRHGLYVREAGSGPRYVVQLETSSREEAETILSLIQAQLRARVPAREPESR